MSAINVTLIFNGDRAVKITSKDAEAIQLLQLMFSGKVSWQAKANINGDGTEIELRPVTPKPGAE